MLRCGSSPSVLSTPLAHLARGFIGKGHGQYLVRQRALGLDEISDADDVSIFVLPEARAAAKNRINGPSVISTASRLGAIVGKLS